VYIPSPTPGEEEADIHLALGDNEIVDLRQLELFCAVVNQGGFSQAGRLLGLSQPSVSFQITSLERELGVRLLDRRKREVSLTAQGEVFYRYARRMLELAQEAREALGELEGLLQGRLVLGASTIPGEYILPPLLGEFAREHPQLEVELRVFDSGEVIQRVREDELELGAVGALERDHRLEVLPLLTERLVLIAPKPCSWCPSGRLRPEELRGLPFVLREASSGTRQVARRHLEAAGLRERDLRVVLRLGSVAAVKRAVAAGVGVSIVSEHAVAEEVRLGILQVLELEGVDLSRRFFLIHRRGRSLSPAANALLRFLAGRFPELEAAV